VTVYFAFVLGFVLCWPIAAWHGIDIAERRRHGR